MLPGVSKTAILTLRARADEHAREDRIFEDPIAAEWFARVTWTTDLDEWYGNHDAQENLAFRADDIDHILARYVREVDAKTDTVVELGCGLGTRNHRLADLSINQWYDLDLPEVIALRKEWGSSGEHHHNIAADVLDFSWMDRIEGDRIFFIVEGVLCYLPRDQVDLLLNEMRERFKGSVVLMDVLGANDYPKLLENSKSVGSPIVWHFEGNFDDVLETFGLLGIEGFEPDTLTKAAMDRYWHRYPPMKQTFIYIAYHNEAIWSRRSGMVLGRL